uniref:Cadherin n=1 Tax=Schistosoma mansoni TaxID=6183 RepID=A0A5K4F4W8_SCHMA
MILCNSIQLIMFSLFIIKLVTFNSSTIYSLTFLPISSNLLLLSSSSLLLSSTSTVLMTSKYKKSGSLSINHSTDWSYQSILNKINNHNHNHREESLKSFNKQITYTLIEEEFNLPKLIGNLIDDLQLNNYLLNYILNYSPNTLSLWNNHNNQSKQLLSIDLIANQYPIINNQSNHDLARLYLFPSNQWSSNYFHINYYNLFKQELIQIKKLDRDQLCHYINDNNNNNNNSNTMKHIINPCICFKNICSIINNQSINNQSINNRSTNNNQLYLPYCQFTITLAMNLLNIDLNIMTILIQLMDINDNVPKFQWNQQNYIINFIENDQIGKKYQLPIAIDNDLCLHSNIDYQLEWINKPKINNSLLINYTTDNTTNNTTNNQYIDSINYFSLIFNKINNNNQLLEIQLDHKLDREWIDKYELHLLAIDHYYQYDINKKQHTTTLSLIIYIQDVNDCKPEFNLIQSLMNTTYSTTYTTYNNNNETLYIEVPENVRVGQVITKFHAIDKDIGKNSEIQYRISQYTHSITKLLNSTTGELIIQQSLDRELLPLSNGLHYLTITAYDQGIPQRSSNLFMIINILDINDNFPMIHLIDETEKFKKSNTQQSPWQQMIQSNNNNNHNNTIKNNQYMIELWQSISNHNKSINIHYIINQLNNYSIHTNMIGNQPMNTIVNILIINDPDLNENGTVQCFIKNQLLIYLKQKNNGGNNHSNNNNNYNLSDKLQFISMEPFNFIDPLNYRQQQQQQQQHEQQKEERIVENRKFQNKMDINLTMRENSMSSKKRKKESRMSKKQDVLPGNNTNNSNIDSLSNHNSYQLRTNMIFDPDQISDLYLLIECSDYGLPSLTTMETIHFNIIQPDIHSISNELHFSHLQILNPHIINDNHCLYFNYFQQNFNIRSLFINSSSSSSILDTFGHDDDLSLRKRIYPTRSSVCLILMANIQIYEPLFNMIININEKRKEENFQIIYKLIEEIPNENYFTINSTTGIVSLMKQFNKPTNITKQLMIQASKIGTLYDYSKNLNYKIQILINMTILNFKHSFMETSSRSSSSERTPYNNDDRVIIYLRMNSSNSLIKTYSNYTYEFDITHSIQSGDSVVPNIIVYCIKYPLFYIENYTNHHCELTMYNEMDTFMSGDKQNMDHFLLKPIKFLCHNNNQSNVLCNGYTIHRNHLLKHQLKDRYILTITSTTTSESSHGNISKNSKISSIKIILYIKENQYQKDQFIKEPFYFIKSINEPFKSIFNKLGLKPPYCITNLSISYKVYKDYVIMKLNSKNEKNIKNKKIFRLRHIWLLSKSNLMNSNHYNNEEMKIWNGIPFITLNPYTGILSIIRELLLKDVGDVFQ